MKNKKASHVGVILSFVIFITFLVFIFSIFGSPIKLPSNKDPLIDYIEVELTNKFSSNLTILTISPDPSVGKNCIQISNTGLGFQDLNSLVKDKDDKIVRSNPNKGSLLYIDWSRDENFFKIFYSEETLDNLEYNGDITDCYTLMSTNINALRENKYFNVNKISDFLSQYDSNYSGIKDELNVPQNNEFSLSFTDAEGNILETEQRDMVTNVYSREIPIQYFNKSANINSGFINIKVW